jgi:hypothetical protein
MAIAPQWTGDGQARLPLQASTGRTLVLFKESLFPGWSARLETPQGSTAVALAGGEMDFMLATLDSVPPGSTLVLTYGPTLVEQGSWYLSAVAVAVLAVWALRPELYGRLRRRLGARLGGAVGRLGDWGGEEDEEPARETAKIR